MSPDWTPVTIASIVEGDGEVVAVPKLLHRIAAELGVGLLTPAPQRVPRGKLTTAGGIERWTAATAPRVPGRGGVIARDSLARPGPKADRTKRWSTRRRLPPPST